MSDLQTRVIAWPARLDGNPYIELLYKSIEGISSQWVIEDFSLTKLLIGRWDIWHLHWPEYFFNLPNPVSMALRTSLLGFLIVLAKARGIKVVWTCHNLRAHEGRYPRLEKWFMDWFTSQVDGTIALTPGGANLAIQRYPGLRLRPLAIVPHGHYIGIYPNNVSRVQALRKLGIPDGKRVLLHIGHIRPYKNVTALIRAFRSLSAPDAVLVIAGRPRDKRLETEIQEAAKGDGRISLHLRFIPDNRLQYFLNAADLIVLPYQDILNSGAAIMALSFGRPVLVPNRGAMAELQQVFGPSYVLTYDGDITTQVLSEVMSSLQNSPQEQTTLQFRVQEKLAWDRIAVETINFYRGVLAR